MTAAMTPGTYRTRSGTLVHCTPRPDGTLRCDREDRSYSGTGGEELVKLSDDPYWPDAPRPLADPLLFAD
ncbi:MAG TPA: hypothetical protein VJP45_14650 [Candidatus Limnocylindria bacterium]|nr:hypothetical protein [Candidatus Limnocylindria bacterium]